MSKLAQASSKYVIYAKFKADGVVEKPDIIGAVFGQTEGLLGPEMDLRELQRSGRIGRIDVEFQTKDGKTSGTIIIPSSLDASETSLIAATMETIERVGPCNAKIKVEKIDDVRVSKREFVVKRAKQLLDKVYKESSPDIQEISETVKKAVRTHDVTDYKGLPAGPDIGDQDPIIIVEGRADVVNLLRYGINNIIAMNGTSTPQAIKDLTKEKNITVFLDGDRGGDLLLKELSSTCDIDFVARAPRGKEVEELTSKEIFKALRDKTQFTKRKPRKRVRIDPEKLKQFKKKFNELVGTHAAYFLNKEMEIIGKVPIKEISNTIKNIEADILMLDGKIEQPLVIAASRKGIKWIIGTSAGMIKVSERVKILTLDDLG